MLYTDADFVTAAQLAESDKDVARIAIVESITIATVISRTLGRAGQDLLSQAMSHGVIGSAGLSGNHLARVLNTGQSMNAPVIRLGQVVVHSLSPGYESPLATWALFRILEEFYLEAMSRKPQDDYFSDKAESYRDRGRNAWRVAASQGIPVVLVPIPCPGAVHEPDSGTWSVANLSAVTAGSGAQQVLTVAITYVGDAYVSATDQGNAESGLSAQATITVAANKVLHIDIASLHPPTGSVSVGTSQNQWVNMAAVGWNVYVSVTGGIFYLQNASPIPIATKSYQLTGAAAVSGSQSGNGQFPDMNVTIQRRLNRA